jgi:Protein of unknown function (DUF3293)
MNASHCAPELVLGSNPALPRCSENRFPEVDTPMTGARICQTAAQVRHVGFPDLWRVVEMRFLLSTSPEVSEEHTMDRPSPVEPLSALVDRTLTVAHIGSSRLWTVDPSEKSADAAAALAARDFDIAGVGGSRVTHFVRRADLEELPTGRVRTRAVPIPASMCVEKSLPLSQLFHKLRESDFAFVLDGDEVAFVVTRADLQAPAIGVVVLAYLTLIESGLQRLVMTGTGDSFLDLLPAVRQAKVEELFQQKVRQNVATGYEDCLYFSDWLTLTRKSGVWKRLGFESGKAFDNVTGSFTDVRNNLAHGGTILDGNVAALVALERVDRIRSLAENVWNAVDGLDDTWDAYAATVISRPRGGAVLAGPGAVAILPTRAPMHAITAWNPDSLRRSRVVNRAANGRLQDLLLRHGTAPKMVIGESPDGRWREESYLVGGLARARAAEIGALFGQRAVFELTADVLHVIRCSDESIVRSVPRIA